jgi:hypothetical protein
VKSNDGRPKLTKKQLADWAKKAGIRPDSPIGQDLSEQKITDNELAQLKRSAKKFNKQVKAIEEEYARKYGRK